MRAVPVTVVLSLLMLSRVSFDAAGFWLAVASGALASGLGYAIWYTALPALKNTSAATVQLSVPVIAAVGGVLFLDEQLTLRLVLASIAILGGIALVIWQKRPARET
jgi:drug/metabolite transporter (DMT)-like permease